MRRAAHVHIKAFKASHCTDFIRRARHQISFLAENLHEQPWLIGMTFDE